MGDLFSYRGRSDDILARVRTDLAEGTTDLASLDCHAVLFAWDHTRREVHAITDRLGTMHAYLSHTNGPTRLGTHLGAVACPVQELDWEAITGFCAFGYYPADRTMYRGVHILRPATWTKLNETGKVISASRYWSWTHDPQGHRSDDDLVDEFHDVWTRTLDAQCQGRRVVVPVSGGLDSRTVLAAIDPAETPLQTYSYGYSPRSRELAVARRVGKARGIGLREFVVPPYLFDRIDQVQGASEGFQALCFTRQAGIAEHLPAMGDRVVGGHLGDLWFDRAGVASDLTSSALVDAALPKLVRRGSDWLLQHVCASHLGGADPLDVVRGFVEEDLARIPELGDSDLTLKIYKVEQWVFRWTVASMRAYQLGAPNLLPFCGNDVVDFFLRVPSDRIPGRRLQVAYLVRHHPDLARVTWDHTGLPLNPTRLRTAAGFAERVARKAGRALRPSARLQRNWEVQYLAPTGLNQLRTLLRDTATPALTPPAALEALLTDFAQAPSGANGYTVDALATLAVTVSGSQR